MKKNILIFLMEHNFIDQVTPIIETAVDNNYRVILIKSMHNYNYNSDKNLNYLIDKYSDRIEVSDLFLEKNFIYSFLHNMFNKFNYKQSIIDNFIIKTFFYILATISRRTIVKLIDFSQDKLIEIFDKYQIKKDNSLIVFDLTDSDYIYRKIRQFTNNLNYNNISFHHSFYVVTNKLTTYNNIDSFNKENFLDLDGVYTDRVIVYNKNSLNFTKKYSLKNTIITQLPSLRYSTKWIENIKRNRDKFTLENDNKYKLKIIFMLSHVDYNTWREELFRTISMVLLQKDIFLAVKVHPRSIKEKSKFLKIKNTNFKIIANEISSSSLIDWADVVMNISSGIIMEAVIKRKPIFYINYLHCNSITVESTENIIHKIDTRDQLVELLLKYKEDVKQNYIDENETKDFLKDYIGNDNFQENQEKYLELFETMFQQISEKRD